MATAITLTRRVGPRLVALDVVARESGLHPDLVRQFVRLGLIEPAPGAGDPLLFAPDSGARLARAARLRRDLGLSYGAAVLACELLGRIDELEARLHRYEPPNHGPR